MHIQLKAQPINLKAILISQFNYLVDKYKLQHTHTALHGDQGMNFIFEYENSLESNVKVKVSINNSSILIEIYMNCDSDDNSNFGLNLTEGIESISLDQCVFDTIPELYDHLKDIYDRPEQLTIPFELPYQDMSSPFYGIQNSAIEYVNQFIQEGVDNKTLYILDDTIYDLDHDTGQHGERRSRILKDEFSDTVVHIVESGDIYVQSNLRYVNDLIQYTDTTKENFIYNNDRMSFDELWKSLN